MPKIVDHDKRRKELAQAAISVIDMAGLDGLRLVDVGKAAGATTGTVTHYLGDKKAVLIAALDQVAQAINHTMTPSPSAETAGGLMAGFDSLLPTNDLQRKDWRVWIAYWGGAIGDDDLATRHRDHYDRFRRQLADRIRRLPNHQDLPHPPDMCADLMISALDGVGTRATLEPDHWSPERQRSHLRALLAPLLTPNQKTEHD